jgi:quercetin dioxygenase-like cupin family protein
MDAVTPGVASHAGLDATRSRHVKVDDLPWEQTRFPGCEAKTLLVDRKSGLATVLMRMAPGAEIPDHEHPLIEQTYMLEGRLVDKEGPDAGLSVGPGEFVWRPPGSRHVAYCPEGGLMIAMFQVPNKFFERDGRVLDLLGRDWELNWGRAMTPAENG